MPDRFAVFGLRPQLREDGIGEIAVGHLDAIEASRLEGFDDAANGLDGRTFRHGNENPGSLPEDHELATSDRRNSKICTSRDSRIGWVVLAWTR